MWACVCLLSLCVSIKYNEKEAEEKEGFFFIPFACPLQAGKNDTKLSAPVISMNYSSTQEKALWHDDF